MTKEEPLIKQLVRTRALNTREGSASPTRRQSNIRSATGNARSLSQPPLRMTRAPTPPTVYTLQLLPYSVVYPPPKKATPKVSFCSVSQPDLTKIITSSPTLSRCTTPSMTISGCGTPMTAYSPMGSPRACTPPLGVNSPQWGYYNNLPSAAGEVYRDANNNEQDQQNPLDLLNNVQIAGNLNNVCKCPQVQKDACFSSLCCEMCKLFPPTSNQNKNQNNNNNPELDGVANFIKKGNLNNKNDYLQR